MNIKKEFRYRFVYKTTNLANGKIYVGQRSTNKVDDHYLGSGSLLFKAIKKYGRENFKREILEFCYSLDSLCEREIFWIAKLHARDKNIGYNIAEGGKINSLPGELNPMWGRRGENNPNTGRKATKETKEKISLSNKGRVVSVETREKIGKGNKGKVVSKETREKQSLVGKGKKKPESQRIKLSLYRKQFKYTEEQKLKNSLGQKNRPLETCPHCGFQGKGCIKRWHFDNCYLVSTRTRDEQSKKSLGRIISEESIQKSRKTKLNKPIVTCPHCGFTGRYSSAMKRFHFDNCKHKS